jgi:agmatinase
VSKEEKIRNFDPNGIGLNNGNLFGLPFSEDESEVIIVPVPWDVTASYAKGSARGPKAILKASPQLDLHDLLVSDAWKIGIHMTPISDDWITINDDLGMRANRYIEFLENGGKVAGHEVHDVALAEINEACKVLEERVHDKTGELLGSGKLVGVLGGEHSVSLGLMKALAKHHNSFGILQLDAHADLRIKYEGFEHSHASTMHNALQLPAVSKLVQVGVRDLCEAEVKTINKSNGRIVTYYDQHLKKQLFEGITWKTCCDAIVKQLPEKVYISCDIDALDPKLCPNTGTPVPGGMEYEQAIYLLQQVVHSGKTIIGFDLCEVAPSPNSQQNDWDGNVGARLLYQLSILMYHSNQ